MTDLAVQFRSDILAYDLVMNATGSDLLTDDSLYPAVIVSLLTDRLADIDDLLPDGKTGRSGGDRRGYWGDVPLPGAPDYPTPNLYGSRLWLLSRAKQLPETLRQAEAYASEALAWMIEDGVATSVTPTATFSGPGRMRISTAIVQGGVSSTYETLWDANPSSPSGQQGGPPASDVLDTSGQIVLDTQGYPVGAA